MTTLDRRTRAQRTTALTCAAMALVLLGSMLVIWSDGGSVAARTAEQTAFGRIGALAVIAAAMVVLVLAIVGMAFRRVVVPLLVLALVAVAVVGVSALTGDEPALGLLLFGAVAAAVPLTRYVLRRPAPRAGVRPGE